MSCSRLARPICSLLIICLAGSCTYWTPSTTDPRTLIQREGPLAVRVTRIDGARIEVVEPVIRSDSIRTALPCERYYTADGRPECRNPQEGVALDAVRDVEVRRTEVLVPVLVVGLGAFALLASWASSLEPF